MRSPMTTPSSLRRSAATSTQARFAVATPQPQHAVDCGACRCIRCATSSDPWPSTRHPSCKSKRGWATPTSKPPRGTCTTARRAPTPPCSPTPSAPRALRRCHIAPPPTSPPTPLAAGREGPQRAGDRLRERQAVSPLLMPRDNHDLASVGVNPASAASGDRRCHRPAPARRAAPAVRPSIAHWRLSGG